MKKIALVVLGVFYAAVAHAEIKNYSGRGEIGSVDPVYGRVTIKHGPIKGVGPSGEQEFAVASPDLLKSLSRFDLVDFTVTTEGASEKITSITKTGVAEQGPEGLPIGKALQGALESTAGVAKAVTSPLPPAHEVVSATTDATTNATGAVLDDASTEVKSKF